MKKFLLATTALVFTAGYAAADGHSSISVSGEAIAGFKYSGADEDTGNTEETELFLELDFGLSGSVTTDSGITFGASLDFDLESTNDSQAVDDPEVFMSVGGVTVTVGRTYTPESDVVGGFADPGFDGIGIDNAAETFWDNGNANVQVQYETGPILVVASTNVAESDTDPSEDYSVGAKYDAGAFSVGAAVYEYNDYGVGDISFGTAEIIALGANVTAGGADIALFYHQADTSGNTLSGVDIDDEEIAGYGASVSYPVGGLTLIGSVGATDLDDDEVDFGVGFEYGLGAGVTLAGGLGSVDDPLADDDSYATADIGVKLKF